MKTNIKYSDVIRLGFKETKVKDDTFFKEFGFGYSIIEFKLNKYSCIDWAKESRKCEILKCGKEGDVLERIDIPNLLELEKIIEIYNIIKDNK